MKLPWILPLIALVCLGACTAPPHPLEGREKAIMSLKTQRGSHDLVVYLAQSEHEKAQGLMQVPFLPQNHGMLFIYDSPGQPSFWMKNMKMSLDFIYLNADGKVVDLLKNIPPCLEKNDFYCQSYQPKEASQYVLEVPAGWIDKVELDLGHHFEWLKTSDLKPSEL